MTQPKVSVVMPVYNTELYVVQAVNSVLNQTFQDFELIIVDDQGQDGSIEICRGFSDPRIRIVSQENRGLAGARNTGIRNARGQYIAFLDSDDWWAPKKLARHVAHLDADPCIGVSYSASQLVDDFGNPMRILQAPKLKGVRLEDVYLRNPVGNGSAPVIRIETLLAISEPSIRQGETNFFNEDLRQSEDIECWVRIALQTPWRFEGLAEPLTYYRVNTGGLSANIIRQFETWLCVRDRVRRIDPAFAREWEALAEAFQLRYLARRAIKMADRGLALSLALRALRTAPSILFREPHKTLTTLGAAMALRCFPKQSERYIQTAMMRAS